MRMNKETKMILHENNKLEKQISKKSNEVYTNMIVYMRGSEISEYNQEKVRRDILDMIIEGEKRGDNIEEIIGNDYKDICDKIISVFPSKTIKERIMSIIGMTLACIYILGTISVLQTLLYNFVGKEPILGYSLSIGDIINAVLIILIANVIVSVVSKNVFKKPFIDNKILSFLVTWIICVVIICGLIGISYYLDNVVIKTNLIAIVMVSLVAFIANKIVDNKY
jgi:DNA-binding ferritin-like protein (Dps family)